MIDARLLRPEFLHVLSFLLHLLLQMRGVLPKNGGSSVLQTVSFMKSCTVVSREMDILILIYETD